MTRTEARARLYALLALPLYAPDAESWEPVCAGDWSREIEAVLRALGLDLAVPPSLGPRPCHQAVAEYREALAAPGHPVRPVESLYKPWTTDPSAGLPIAAEKGWLGGDPAAHLRALYAELGVELPPGLAHAPDHLALELELMAWLVEEGTPEQQELFRRQHLDWLWELAADAKKRGAPRFYQDLLELTAAFVSQDRPV
ncbi:MAG: TorD/DmsD family molecular chaperone [Bacillota bacterium]